MKKIILKNKRFTALALSVILFIGMLIPILSIGITKVHAHRAAHGSLDTYYEIEFADNTTDERFTGENYTTGEAIEFLFRLEKKFKDEEQNEIDAYSLRLTKEDMDKSDINLLEDLKFITKEIYPYYETPNIETLQMISLTSNSLIQDYYIGDLSERKEIKALNEEEANVIVLSAPIFKLNRNVEKTVVDYEGDLSEETKNEIISRVKEANPNMSNMKEIYISENKLIIETWNRFHAGTPYLEFDVENLIKRVAHTETQTDTKVKVKVIYKYKDGKAYKEFIVESDKGTILDASDLEMLPEGMAFDDDFMFYEVKDDGNDLITRIVKKIKEDKQSIEIIQNVEINLSEIDKLISELDKRIASFEKTTLTKEQEAKIRDLEKQKEELAKLLEETKKDSKTENNDAKLNAKIDELVKKNNELADKVNKLIEELNKQTENSNKTGNTGNTNKNNPSVADGSKEIVNKDTKGSNYSNKEEKELEIRYPNKLTPKEPANNNSQNSQMDGSNKNANTNKGVASDPSKARATVTESVNNGNGEYPIHHSDSMECACNGMYSADARQFITFQTKSGKTFHLIINHDEDSENVMLLTEVSEDDLLNFVEAKETTEPVKEVVKEEPVKEVVEPEKKEESNMGTYLILFLVVGGALGAGYYFKVVKKKEDKELEGFEEEDDDFFSEAEDYDDNDEDVSETDDVEVLEDNEDEE